MLSPLIPAVITLCVLLGVYTLARVWFVLWQASQRIAMLAWRIYLFAFKSKD